jgi:hypothetical protein
MSIQDRVSMLNDLIQASFGNAMNAVESIHRTGAEMPLGVLKELGFPEEKVAPIRDSHREILRLMYGGIVSANKELGNLMVLQTGELTKFAGGMIAAGYKAKSGYNKAGSSWSAANPANDKQITAAKPAAKTVAKKTVAKKKTGAKKPAGKSPT